MKTLTDFTFNHIPQATRDLISHLAGTTFVGRRENVVLLGPPGTGKTHVRLRWPSKRPRRSWAYLAQLYDHGLQPTVPLT